MSEKTYNYVKLHADLFVPGYGSFGTTLPSSSKSLNLSMVEGNGGLMIIINQNKPNQASVFVPWSNVSHAVLKGE